MIGGIVFSEDAESIFEVHAPYILIREIEGGGGFSEIKVRIFRLWRHGLYNTFEIEEQASGVGGEMTRVVNNRIRFRFDASPTPGLEVRKDETVSLAGMARRPDS